MFNRHTIVRRVMDSAFTPTMQRGNGPDERRTAARGMAIAAAIGVALWAAIIWALVQILGRLL